MMPNNDEEIEMAIGKVATALAAGGLVFAVGFGATYATAEYRGSGHGGWHGGGWHGKHGGHKRGGMMRMLAKADKNNDGEVTTDEIREMRAKRFKHFDTNEDGIVTREEVEKHVRERIERRVMRRTEKMFRRFDKDRNGEVTKDEFDRHALERFSWHDFNDDGKLSGDELPRRFHRMKHYRGSHGEGHGDHKRGSHGEGETESEQ